MQNKRRLGGFVAGIVAPSFAALSLASLSPTLASAQVPTSVSGAMPTGQPEGMVEPVALAIPALPVAPASAASPAWSEWSAEQQQSFESTHWTAVPGCTITSVTYSPVPVGSAMSNVPPSATMTAATIIGKCSASAISPSAWSVATSPGSSANPTIPVGDTCGSITLGTERVGYGTNSRYALYQYLGSGAATRG